MTAADLLRVRVVSTPGPLAEAALAHSVLQPRAAGVPARRLARTGREQRAGARRRHVLPPAGPERERTEAVLADGDADR